MLKLGNTDIGLNYNKAYLGTNLVYDNTSTPIPLANIISEYKYENNANDTVGSNNGTAFNLTYASGLVGQEGIYNGSTSYIQIPDNNDFSFTDGVKDLPFSISCLVRFDAPTTNTGMLVSKMTSAGTFREYDLRYTGSIKRIDFNKYSNTTNIYRRSSYTFPTAPSTLDYVHIIVTNADNLHSKIYVNGFEVVIVESDVGYIKLGSSTGDVWLGKFPNATSLTHDGSEDCVRFWNKELSPAEILEIATQELSGIDINP